MDRRTLGGWLEGPGAGLPDTSQDYRGQRLGLPQEGAGSVAGLGRRVVAITLDWFIAILISRVVAPGVEYPSDASSWLILGIFFLVATIMTTLTGMTIGQRILGIRVVRLARAGESATGHVPLPWALVRTALLCLVIPAVVVDRDQRGLHDKAARTVVVRLG